MERRLSKSLPHQIGPYRLEEKLGSGGMGVVYKAVDTALDRVVAIKMMHAREILGDEVDLTEVQARFLREAKAAARIKSRHVAQVLQLGTSDEGEAYIVMEVLHGVALSKVMHKGGPMKPARVVHIARQICRGMQSAHDLGVVHRDLKPANVMLISEEGDADFVKILDFGVAKLTDETQTQGLTQAGALLGTLPFMAPEQISGGVVDARTDIYALGIILYRMFTGLTVWDADSLSDIVRHQMSSVPVSMFERVTNALFTPAMDDTVRKCLAKDPAARWQSMRELAVALDAASGVDVVMSRGMVSAEGSSFDDATDLIDKGTSPTGNVRTVDVDAATSVSSAGVPTATVSPSRSMPAPWVPTQPVQPSWTASTARAPSSRSLSAASEPAARKGLLIAAASVVGVVLVVVLVIGGASMSTTTPPTTTTTTATPLPPVSVIPAAVVVPPAAEPVVVEPVVVEPVVVEPVKVAKPPPPTLTTTPTRVKPPAPVKDDGFVRVRTKDD